MSVELSTSRESAPTAWPSWMPNMAPPMFASMEDAPPIMDFISSGIWVVIALDRACEMLTATGSVSRRHESIVASTHSARDHALPRLVVEGKSVTGSSHI